MAKINWEMMSQFIFPKEYGIVEEVVSVQVIPHWKQEETEESIRLTGIYHIKATLKFNPAIKPNYSEGTFIEHIDLKGDEGYFEYAMPLEVDLPREKVAEGSRPELEVEGISFFVYDGSSCTFKWDVECFFEEPVKGTLFQVESQEKAAERVAVVAANTGEVLEASKTEQPPSTLEHRLINHVLESKTAKTPKQELGQTMEETFSKQTGQTAEERNSEQLFGRVAEQPLTDGNSFIHSEADSPLQEAGKNKAEPNQQYNYVEEAKRIRKEQEERKLGNESSSKLLIDEKFKLPSETDDFFNELPENYSILKFK